MDFGTENGLHILVIEDNEGDARLIEHKLRSKRRSFFTTPTLKFAETLDAGIELLESERFDLALLDLGLPESDGLDTLERMSTAKEKRDDVDDVPIVVLTGLKDEQLALEAIQQGAQDYLMKGNLDEDILDRAIRYGLERHRQEQRLRRQTEQLEDFTTAISHDIRTPLDTAMGHVRILTEEYDHDSLDQIEHTLGRMDEMVDDLLTLARKGQMVEQTERVNLASVVENAWHTVDTGDATLAVDGDTTIVADRNRLYHVFENLFRNSIEHGDGDVTVRVDCTDAGFSVADDGPGFATNDIQSIFEAGYTTSDDGTGYGLKIVENMVEAHGWEINATGSERGGARFDITGVEFTDT